MHCKPGLRRTAERNTITVSERISSGSILPDLKTRLSPALLPIANSLDSNKNNASIGLERSTVAASVRISSGSVLTDFISRLSPASPAHPLSNYQQRTLSIPMQKEPPVRVQLRTVCSHMWPCRPVAAAQVKEPYATICGLTARRNGHKWPYLSYQQRLVR